MKLIYELLGLTSIIHLPKNLSIRQSIRVFRRIIKETKPHHRHRLQYRHRIKIPSPGPSHISISRRYRSSNDRYKRCQIRENHAYMSPFIRQQLGYRKCRHLTIRGSKAGDGHSGCDCWAGLCGGDDEMPDGADGVTADEEVSTAEKIGVGSAVGG
jgi:hypothetical protein